MAVILTSYSILVISLLAVVFASTLQIWKYECMGYYSKMSNGDCRRTANQLGCYHLDTVYQYRSCASICNDVIMSSAHGRQCEVYCREYIEHSCNKVLHTTTTSTTKPADITTYDRPLAHLRSTRRLSTPTSVVISQSRNSEWKDLTITLAIVAVVLVVLLVVVCWRVRARGLPLQKLRCKGGIVHKERASKPQSEVGSMDTERGIPDVFDGQNLKPTACSDSADTKAENKETSDERDVIIDENRNVRSLDPLRRETADVSSNNDRSTEVPESSVSTPHANGEQVTSSTQLIVDQGLPNGEDITQPLQIMRVD